MYKKSTLPELSLSARVNDLGRLEITAIILSSMMKNFVRASGMTMSPSLKKLEQNVYKEMAVAALEIASIYAEMGDAQYVRGYLTMAATCAYRAELDIKDKILETKDKLSKYRI